MKKQFRNKWIYLIVVSVSVISFAACSDDDDDVPAFSKDGKRLVKSLTYVGEDIRKVNADYPTQANFKYNGEGQMTEIEIRYVYGSYIYMYSVSRNKLIVKHVYKEDGEYGEYDKLS